MKSIIIFLLAAYTLPSKAQFSSGCFEEAHERIIKDVVAGIIGTKDSSGTVFVGSEERARYYIGCTFPYAPLRSYDDKEINPVNLKADLVLINYNYTYSQVSLLQLEKLAKFKKESKKDIKIIVLFKEKKEDLKEVIDQYKDLMYIVADAEKWMNTYSLDMGYPLNYVLNKNKTITHLVSGGGYNDKDAFSKTLVEIK